MAPRQRQRETEIVAQQHAVGRNLETLTIGRLGGLVLPREIERHAEAVMGGHVARVRREDRLEVDDRRLGPVEPEHGASVAAVRRGIVAIALQHLLVGLGGIVEHLELEQGVAQQNLGVGPSAVERDRLLIDLDRRRRIARRARRRRQAQQGPVAAVLALGSRQRGVQARLDGLVRGAGRDDQHGAAGQRQNRPALPRSDGHGNFSSSTSERPHAARRSFRKGKQTPSRTSLPGRRRLTRS